MGVIEKGLRLLAESDRTAGRAGVLGHADHAWRCVMIARSRVASVPLDLLARSFTG